MTARIRRRVLLDFQDGGRFGSFEVRTRDIGGTIGTEILSYEGQCLVAYRSGTRYPDRAEEIAAELLRDALDLARSDVYAGRDIFDDAFETRLLAVVAADSAGPWIPDEEEEDEW